MLAFLNISLFFRIKQKMCTKHTREKKRLVIFSQAGKRAMQFFGILRSTPVLSASSKDHCISLLLTLDKVRLVDVKCGNLGVCSTTGMVYTGVIHEGVG